jgi:uncharacterized protein (DUF736 family)
MELVKLTGLWKDTDKKGQSYLRGKINNNAKIVIMKNLYKRDDNDPDFNLYVTGVEIKKEKNSSEQSNDLF